MPHEAPTRILGIALMTLVATCSAQPKAGSVPQNDAPPPAAAVDAATILMLCGADTVSVSGATEDALDLHVHGETFRMHHVPSGSGAKYQADADTTTVFMSQGNRAMIQIRGQAFPECEMIVSP